MSGGGARATGARRDRARAGGHRRRSPRHRHRDDDRLRRRWLRRRHEGRERRRGSSSASDPGSVPGPVVPGSGKVVCGARPPLSAASCRPGMAVVDHARHGRQRVGVLGEEVPQHHAEAGEEEDRGDHPDRGELRSPPRLWIVEQRVVVGDDVPNDSTGSARVRTVVRVPSVSCRGCCRLGVGRSASQPSAWRPLAGPPLTGGPVVPCGCRGRGGRGGERGRRRRRRRDRRRLLDDAVEPPPSCWAPG